MSLKWKFIEPVELMEPCVGSHIEIEARIQGLSKFLALQVVDTVDGKGLGAAVAMLAKRSARIVVKSILVDVQLIIVSTCRYKSVLRIRRS